MDHDIDDAQLSELFGGIHVDTDECKLSDLSDKLEETSPAYPLIEVLHVSDSKGTINVMNSNVYTSQMPQPTTTTATTTQKIKRPQSQALHPAENSGNRSLLVNALLLLTISMLMLK